MRTRMYGGVRGRKTKVGGKPTFVFLLLDYIRLQLRWDKSGQSTIGPFLQKAVTATYRPVYFYLDNSTIALSRMLSTLFS